MSEDFFGFELLEELPLFSVLRSIEAWRAHKDDTEITLVRPRKDICAAYLNDGDPYFSNVAALEEDLLRIRDEPPPPGTLALLEIHRVGARDLPVGVFEAFAGAPLRTIITRNDLDCPQEIAAALALEILLDENNMVRFDGGLDRWILPHFSSVWEREAPSFTGLEPGLSETGKILEIGQILRTLNRGKYSALELIQNSCFAGRYNVDTLMKVLEPWADRDAIAPFLRRLPLQRSREFPGDPTLRFFWSTEDGRPMVPVEDGTRSFLIDRTLVSNGAFNRFLISTGTKAASRSG